MKIADIPFTPQYSEENYKKVSAWLEKGDFRGAANFCVASGNFLSENTNNGCHYYIGNGRQERAGQRELVGTEGKGWKRKELPKALALVYAEYLCRDSWASRFILNRDDPEKVLESGFILSADMPAPLLQNICIMTRHFYEVGQVCFEVFSELLKNGVPPDLAYLTTFCSTMSGYSTYTADTRTKFDAAAHSYYNVGHRPFNSVELSGVSNLLAGRLGSYATKQPLFNDTYRNNSNYLGGVNMWVEKNAAYEHWTKHIYHIPALKEEIAEYRKRIVSDESYRPPNPFSSSAPPALPPGNFTNKEMMEVVLPWFLVNKSLWTKPDSVAAKEKTGADKKGADVDTRAGLAIPQYIPAVRAA